MGYLSKRVLKETIIGFGFSWSEEVELHSVMDVVRKQGQFNNWVFQ